MPAARTGIARTRTARALLLAMPIAAQLLASACYSRRPLGTGAPAPSGPVRVRFAAPQDVRVVSPAGDTTLLTGVSELTGLVTALRGDTIDLRMRPVGAASGAAFDARTTVVRAPGDRIEARQLSAARTAGMVAGTTILVAAVALAVGVIVLVGTMGSTY